jgi:hypothetical protein
MKQRNVDEILRRFNTSNDTPQGRQTVYLATMWGSKKGLKERWEKAKAMYGINKSFREIEAELGLPRSSLHRRALAEGWKKGFLMPLVHEIIRIENLLQQLTPTQRKAVEREVERMLKIEQLERDDPSDKNPWLARLRRTA